MSTLRYFLLSFLFFAFCHAGAVAQTLASVDGFVGDETIAIARNHRRLPANFEGFAIEVIRSEFPLESADPVFRQFGNLHYHKLPGGGYSYLIMTDFRDEKSAQSFREKVVQSKAPDSKVVVYKKGTRKVK